MPGIGVATSILTGAWLSILAICSSGRAESVPNTCLASWWTLSIEPPEFVVFRSASPRVAVRAIWQGLAADVTELELAALSVEVRDEHADLVEGNLGMGFPTGPWVEAPLAYTGWSRPDALSNNVWWRPGRELAAGRYVMRTRIPSPAGDEFRGCSYSNYDTVVEFEIQPDGAEPALEVAYSLTVEPTEYVTHSTECADRGEIAFCSRHPNICCWFNLGYTHTVTFTWTDLPQGWSFYHVLEIEYDLIGYPYDRQSLLWHPFPYLWENSEPYILTQSFNPAPWQMPLPPELCARGRVLDILDGSTSLQFDGCVKTAEASRISTRVLACIDEVCAELAGEGKPADVGPEVGDIASGAEPSVGDPGIDGYSSCASGETSSCLLWALALGILSGLRRCGRLSKW